MSDSKPLSQMNKPDLLEAALQLDADLAAERAAHIAAVTKFAAASAAWSEERAALENELAKARASSNPFVGTVPVELWLGGAAWQGSERCLVRCGASGDLAEFWMVKVGGKLLCNDGKGSIQAKPYHQIPVALQARVRWPYAKALEAARGAR